MIEATHEFCFVYTTYPDKDTALKAAQIVIEKKLAACVNVYPPMTSLYVWEDKLEQTSEVAAFIKTRRSLAKETIEVLWHIHSYELPTFVVLPIEAGTTDYLTWVRAQTEQPLTA